MDRGHDNCLRYREEQTARERAPLLPVETYEREAAQSAGELSTLAPTLNVILERASPKPRPWQ